MKNFSVLLVLMVLLTTAMAEEEPQFAPPLETGQPAELHPVGQTEEFAPPVAAEKTQPAPQPTLEIKPVAKVKKPVVGIPIWETREGHDLAAKKVLTGEIAKALKASQETGYILKKYLPYLKTCERRGWVKIRRDGSFKWRVRVELRQLKELVAQLNTLNTQVKGVKGRLERVEAKNIQQDKHLNRVEKVEWFVALLALAALGVGIYALLQRRRRVPSREEEPIEVPEPAVGLQEVPPTATVNAAVPDGEPNVVYIL